MATTEAAAAAVPPQSTVEKRLKEAVGDIDDSDETDEETERREAGRTWSGTLSRCFFTSLWLAGAAIAAHQSDIVGVLLHAKAVRRWVLYLAYVGLGVTTVGCLHLVRTRHPDDYERAQFMWLPHEPHAIPVITGFWVAGSILFAIAVWPVYHILTLPLMFLLFMGFVHALQFLPYTDAGKKPESSKKK